MKKFKNLSDLKNIYHAVFDKDDVPSGEHSSKWYLNEFPKICALNLGFNKYISIKQVHGSILLIIQIRR